MKKAYNKRRTIENSKAIQRLRRVQKPRGTNQEHRRHRRTREQAQEHRSTGVSWTKPGLWLGREQKKTTKSEETTQIKNDKLS